MHPKLKILSVSFPATLFVLASASYALGVN